ncbi:MAG: RsiW-degrading membrane proteinase PrsW (M82 family) [Oceanicoccus sp.]|jgi:RsiW-degrading membrane proteinase PrsW (M82 family)
MGMVALIGGVLGGFILGLVAGLLVVMNTPEGQSKLGRFCKYFFLVGLVSSIAIFCLILDEFFDGIP